MLTGENVPSAELSLVLGQATQEIGTNMLCFQHVLCCHAHTLCLVTYTSLTLVYMPISPCTCSHSSHMYSPLPCYSHARHLQTLSMYPSTHTFTTLIHMDIILFNRLTYPKTPNIQICLPSYTPKSPHVHYRIDTHTIFSYTYFSTSHPPIPIFLLSPTINPCAQDGQNSILLYVTKWQLLSDACTVYDPIPCALWMHSGPHGYSA